MLNKLKELFSLIKQRSISAYETLSSSFLSIIKPLIAVYKALSSWFSSNKKSDFPRSTDVANTSSLSTKPDDDVQQPDTLLSLISPDSASLSPNGNGSSYSSPRSRSNSRTSNP